MTQATSFSVLLCVALLSCSADAAEKTSRAKKSKRSGYAINLTFAHDPGVGKYNGVLGKPKQHWNFIPHGTREVTGLKLANGTTDDASLTLSANDGTWGIEGKMGVYHGYIYHNCRCVDLELTVSYLPKGTYDVIVFAHGDAPDQNAAVTVSSGDTSSTEKRTLNDGSWDFRSRDFSEGNQYVRFKVDVADGEPLKIVSKRDASSYAMLNAVQIRRVGK